VLAAVLALLGAAFGIVEAPSVITVTSNANAGPGTLRTALAACPDRITFAFNQHELWIASTLVVDCPDPIEIVGPSRGGDLAGTTGTTVGVDGTPLPPVARPGVEIINKGGGDGIAVLSPNVTISGLGVRGTTAGGRGDIAIRNTHDVTLRDVALGVDGNGLTAPPATSRTGTSWLWVQDSADVTVEHVAAGWNRSYWGAAVFQNVDGVTISDSFIRGASYGTPGPQTLDAVSFVYGTRNATVERTWIADTSSSSAVEIHGATAVAVTGSTFVRPGRAGVTVFEGVDVAVTGSVVADAGTCGRASAEDMGGVAIYPNSSRVTVAGSDLSTVCDLPAVALL
jgi:hypothetical protein